MKVSRRAQAGSCVVAMVLLTASCASNGTSISGANATPQPGGTLRLALSGDPTGLNPDITTATPTELIGCMIYEGLVQFGENGVIRPLLAKSWTISPDGLTYTFNLVDTQWQDGQPFTSSDVKFSLLEVSAKYGAVFRPAGNEIADITTPDPHTAVVQLKSPFGPFLVSLACPQNGAILPEHLFKGTDVLTNAASNAQPVGTGPFKLSSWVRGDHLTLVRNPNYWQPGKPYLQGIIAHIIPSAPAVTLAIAASELDYVSSYFLPPSDIAQLKKHSTLQVHSAAEAPADELMFFNVRNKPVSDVRVRQALAMATDRQYLVDHVWFGTGTVGVSPIDSRITYAYNPQINFTQMYPHDPAKARQALDAAGYPVGADGYRFTLHVLFTSDTPDRVAWAQALQSMWKAVQVNAVLDGEVLQAESPDAFVNYKHDVTLQNYTSYGDPALGVAREYVTASIGKPFGNASAYSNPTVDDLFAKAAAATGDSARGVYYKQAQAVVAHDLPLLVIREDSDYDVASIKVHNLWTADSGLFPDWAQVWMQQ